MPVDDKETTDTKRAKGPILPPGVERALARAREAAKADQARKEGRWLALVPVAVAIVFLSLLMPRAVKPSTVPIPRTNERAVAAVARADDARARLAESEGLPADILAVGSAIRSLNGAEPRGADEIETIDARRQLDVRLREVAHRENASHDLLSLRALQTRRFLDAIDRWEASGETSDDFFDLAAVFVQRSADVGWVDGRTVLATENERRVAFKTVWNALTGLDSRAEFALTLDEERALYSFYVRHPHPSESRRMPLEAQRRIATTPQACAKANAEYARQSELWRAEKIKRLGAIDPSYPTAYALGVVYYRAGRLDLSAEAFTTYLEAHSDGPYGLRARNHLKAVLAEL